MALTESLPYSLSEAGPTNVAGVGNYIVEVLARGGSHSALSLYLLDTHGYSPDERQFRGYDWIKKTQIEWFKRTAQSRKKAHKEYTHVHMDLAFIHIPLPEYRNANNPIVGSWKETPTAPGFNSGFRDALVQEGILLVSCGQYVVPFTRTPSPPFFFSFFLIFQTITPSLPAYHILSYILTRITLSSSDHVNDYCSLDKHADGKPALWMCYAGGSGFGGYGGYGGYHRRVRFFDIDTNEAHITTYKRVEWGETEKRIDEQTVVDGGRVVES